MTRIRVWLPPVAWMLLILWLSSDTGSSEHTGRILLPALRFLFPSASSLQLDALHALVRKTAHLTEYAVLAALWWRALTTAGISRRRGAIAAWTIAVAWAALDETLQTTVGSRTGTPKDVALDGAGALIAIFPLGFGWRPTVDALTRIALWTAVAAGAVVITLNLATGVGSGVLWLTVPLAAVLLMAIRRAR
jgi:VanZ family protein